MFPRRNHFFVFGPGKDICELLCLQNQSPEQAFRAFCTNTVLPVSSRNMRGGTTPRIKVKPAAPRTEPLSRQMRGAWAGSMLLITVLRAPEIFLGLLRH